MSEGPGFLRKVGSLARHIRVSHKVTIMMFAATLMPCIALSFGNYFEASEKLQDQASERFFSIVHARGDAVEKYLKNIETDLRMISSNPNSVRALESFTWAYEEFGEKAQKVLTDTYGVDGSGTKGAQFLGPENDDMYTVMHKSYHPWFRAFSVERGYGDLYLFDKNGHVVYSVEKRGDFARKFTEDRLASSGLGRAFAEISEIKSQDVTKFTDFSLYFAAGDEPRAFMASAVFNDHKEFFGVLAIQVPLAPIDAIVNDPKGLGETGQVQIVRSDFMTLTNDRFADASTALKTSQEWPEVKKALAGENDIVVADVPEMGRKYVTYAPVPNMGGQWAIVASQDETEVQSPVAEIRNKSLISSAIVVLIFTILGQVCAVYLMKPLGKVTAIMRRMSEGDKNVIVPYADRFDEIGEMARGLKSFQEVSLRAEELAAEQAEQQRQVHEEHKRQAEDAARRQEQELMMRERELHERRAAVQEQMQELAENLSSEIEDAVRTVGSEADSLRVTAEDMYKNVSSVSRETEDVATASMTASENVQSVAAATEELSVSIEEIRRQVRKSGEIADGAVQKAEQTNQSVDELDRAAQTISDIVGLISDIASQTNLLALNATIEAARAGEAGRGFAVVASEVKSLAKQTGQATEQITKQIENMQRMTSGVVSEIEEIGAVIRNIDDIGDTVTSAVNEQGEATVSISKHVQEAAMGNSEVSRRIQEVSERSGETGTQSERVKDVSDVLASAIGDLGSRLQGMLSESVAGDRRRVRRQLIDKAIQIAQSNGYVDARIVDVSDQGAKVVCDQDVETDGRSVVINIPGVADNVKCRIADTGIRSLNLEFQPDAETRKALSVYFSAAEEQQKAA